MHALDSSAFLLHSKNQPPERFIKSVKLIKSLSFYRKNLQIISKTNRSQVSEQKLSLSVKGLKYQNCIQNTRRNSACLT